MTNYKEKYPHIVSSGISGTKIAPIAGLSPYNTPFDVYMSCTGRDKQDESFHYERGQFMEPALLQWYAYRTGAKIQPPEKLFHQEHDYILAISDAYAWLPGEHAPRNIEIKAPNWRGLSHWGKPGTDEIPDYYLPQVMWEMAVSGTNITDVICYQDGDIAIYHVHYDHVFFCMLRDIAHEFWFNHVIPDIPPAIDESDSAREWINQRYPERVQNIGESTPEIDFLVDEYNVINAQLKELDKTKKSISNQLISLMEDHNKVLGSFGSITYNKAKDRLKTDWESIARENNASQELIDKHSITEPGRWTFRVNNSRKKS